MRAPRGVVAERLRQIDQRWLYTSIIVAAELKFGATKKGSERLKHNVEAVLGGIVVKPIEAPLDRIYAEIRTDLESKGTPIADPDLWIAAQALHDGSVLVTDNVKEFGRVPKLKTENWLRP